ncbi:SRPBCC family protein [Aliiroseovarius marinus]|uniref:SRPBCC family protein n=1 Tax=Aliiroseovarius marinus TaxID=2500159 RepID=UPI003D7EEA59
MKFKTHEDIEATIEQVFASLADFDGYERAALRRGAEVIRTGDPSVYGKGMTWQAKFPYRNRERIADMELTEFDQPNQMVLQSKVSGIEAEVLVDLLALSPKRTRMALSIDMRPKTIPARLVLQSLKLARSTMAKRFQKRVADFAQSIEDRHKA